MFLFLWLRKKDSLELITILKKLVKNAKVVMQKVQTNLIRAKQALVRVVRDKIL